MEPQKNQSSLKLNLRHKLSPSSKVTVKVKEWNSAVAWQKCNNTCLDCTIIPRAKAKETIKTRFDWPSLDKVKQEIVENCWWHRLYNRYRQYLDYQSRRNHESESLWISIGNCLWPSKTLSYIKGIVKFLWFQLSWIAFE